jgi:adenylate cyclase
MDPAAFDDQAQPAPPVGPGGTHPAPPVPVGRARHATVRSPVASATGTGTGNDAALRLLGRLGLALAALTLLANLVPGIALFFYLQFTLPAASGTPDPGRADTTMVLVFVVYVVLAVAAGSAGTFRAFAPVLRWIAEDRPATAAEQLAILRQPIDRGLAAFCYWAGAAVVFGVTQAALGYPGARIASVVVGVLLAAVSVTSLDALLIERLLRPVARRALAGVLPARPFGIRVLPRILLSWAFGSGVPLVALLLVPIDHGDERLRTFTLPLSLLCLAGLLSGFVIITGAARAVAEPLRTIRDALERIEAGDLTVEVPVDDGSEVGQLQAGVNRMVAGLRQRRALEDLFGRYVGAEVAGLALERGVGLGGERREATVVFVDLIGSTAMATRLDPEDVVATLNAYFAAVVGAATAEGGWVNKFEGDGALCVFGPPGDGPDHAAAGLRAARRMRAAVADAARSHPELVAAIGVSTGPVVAGTIGSTERFEYTVIGDPVNEAARLTDLAKGRAGRVLASRRAVSAAGSAGADWHPAGEAVLRGRDVATGLYAPPPD